MSRPPRGNSYGASWVVVVPFPSCIGVPGVEVGLVPNVRLATPAEDGGSAPCCPLHATQASKVAAATESLLRDLRTAPRPVITASPYPGSAEQVNLSPGGAMRIREILHAKGYDVITIRP